MAESGVMHQDKPLPVTVSGGLSMYPADGTDWDLLFSAADKRLYAAKQKGRNRIAGPVTESYSMS